MKFKITAEALVFSMKIWTEVIACWPPPLNATRKCLIMHNVAWCAAAFFMGIAIPGSAMHAWVNSDDTATLTKDFAVGLVLVITMNRMIISKCQQSRLQVAHADLETFLKTAGPRERAMLDRYIAKCGKPFVCFQILCIVGSIIFACGPIVLPQPLPAQAEYPFEWRDSPTRIAILYFAYVVATFQAAAGAVFDIRIGFPGKNDFV